METFKGVRNANFGAHLNRLMAVHKLTASDVCRKLSGEQLNARGQKEAKGLQQYGRYMKGVAYPNESTRKKLAEIFAVTIEELENPQFSKQLLRDSHIPEPKPVAPVPAPPPSAPTPFPMLAPAPMSLREKPGKRAYEHLSVVPEPGQPGKHRLRFEAVVDAESVAAFMLTITDLEARDGAEGKVRAHA